MYTPSIYHSSDYTSTAVPFDPSLIAERIDKTFDKMLKLGYKLNPQTGDYERKVMITKGKTKQEDIIGAARDGNLATVKALIASGASVNSIGLNGKTPLHLACQKGHLEVVQYLLEQGADMNAKHNDGGTPLHLACWKGHLEVVQHLTEQGADINAKSNDGWTPLHWACKNGHLAVVQYLREQGSDINTKDRDGWTPLHLACVHGHPAAVQYLIEQRADINAQDNYGRTPLHCACGNGHLAAVQYLMEQGADVNAKDKRGRTALDVSRDDRIRTLLRGTTASACADIPPEIRPPDSMPVAVAAPQSPLAEPPPQQGPVTFTADSNRIVSAARTEDGELRGLLHGMFPADLPLLALLDSLTPIMDSHRDIDIARQVQLAERKAVQLTAKYGTLSSHERAAIVLYTMEAIPRETSVYFMVNAALRRVDREAVRPWRDYIWLLLHALRKLPAITMDTNLYRGMRVSISDLGDAYVTGREFQWAGFSSTSLRVDVMQSEAFLGRSGSRVLFNLKLTESVGRDISDFSLYQEAEILLPPNTMFEVKGVLDAGNDLHYLQCEQTQSLDMLLDFRI